VTYYPSFLFFSKEKFRYFIVEIKIIQINLANNLLGLLIPLKKNALIFLFLKNLKQSVRGFEIKKSGMRFTQR